MEKDLRIQHKVSRGQAFTIQVNGEPVTAYPGETIATALLSVGIKLFHRTSVTGAPRGPFCGMGLCFDCLVTVNGQPNVRACMTVAQPGDQIERQI